GEKTSILATTGRGYFVVAILGARQEPTNHALRDIAAFAGEFEAWNRSMVLLFPHEQDWKNFDPEEFGALPSTITYGVDAEHLVSDMLVSAMHLPDARTLPIFVIADTFGRVVFVSQGYTIGLGEQLLQTIHKL
ncbi:MAG: transglutaminase domain-containing protein, partial [Tannerellaceae bacterium]|nr:transglutaminase domain-containing protein [Tannerellaceae bacterium]